VFGRIDASVEMRPRAYVCSPLLPPPDEIAGHHVDMEIDLVREMQRRAPGASALDPRSPPVLKGGRSCGDMEIELAREMQRQAPGASAPDSRSRTRVARTGDK
jgi:hypothetical protein